MLTRRVQLLLLSGLCCGPVGSVAQESIASRYVAQISMQQETARQLITEAGVLAKAGSEEEASGLYREAIDLLPEAPATQADRDAAVKGYAHYGTRLAAELQKNGDIERAKGLIDDILSPGISPGYEPALRIREDFEDPGVTPMASTPAHRERVDRVEKLLGMGLSAVSLGRYNEAEEVFKSVLRLDPYNTAARRGMEDLETKKAQYSEAARDHTRAERLAEVSAQWESPVPAKIDPVHAQSSGPAIVSGSAVTDIKLKSIIIPNLQLADTTLADAVAFLVKKARESDSTEQDPSKKGINIVVHPGLKDVPINLVLNEIPLGEALRYVSEISGARMKMEPFGVSLVPIGASEGSEGMLTRSYRISPSFMSRQSDASTADAATENPFGGASGDTALRGLSVRRLTAKEILTNYGVAFPGGSSASYENGVLTVHNTVQNLDLVDTVVESARGQDPRQIAVYVKMLDIRQDNVEELGFDWLSGAINLGAGAAFGGGTYGNEAGSYSSGDFISGTGNPITAGNRGASALNSTRTIDQLIEGADAANSIQLKSPGIFSVGGVLTDPQFEMMVRGLNNKKGIDILAAPSVVVRPSQRASIDMVREFIYPVEFEPPEIPQTVGTNGSAAITPTTPTAFEMRNTGISLEVEPTLSPDGKMVSLTLAPSSVVFEGFINYGSPVTDGINILTENRIPQPVFRTNRVSTSVDVYDGQTVMIGGLISDTTRMIDDKTPILGDLPVVGRFFQSQAQSSSRRYVVFFVSVRVIDPAGMPVHAVGEAPENLEYPSEPAPPPPVPPYFPSK